MQLIEMPTTKKAKSQIAQKTEVPKTKRKIRYIRNVEKLDNIPEDVKEDLKKVAEKYVFRANDYYLDLIDWNDPEDPIRQLIIPRVEELEDWGKLDASNEAAVTVAKGVQHKYERTVLLLCNEVCGAYCRYCFRKRLFMDENDEVSLDVTEGIDYIRTHSEVTNVLLTGGDPFLMSTRKLVDIFKRLREIDHVDIIRIGTKMPAFNPWRVLDDPALLEAIQTYSTPEKRIYVMAHFDHPRELTEPAIEGLDALMKAGAIVVNQCPLIKGVNDMPGVLGEMYQILERIGVPPTTSFKDALPKAMNPMKCRWSKAIKFLKTPEEHLQGWAAARDFVCRTILAKSRYVGSMTNSSTRDTNRPRTPKMSLDFRSTTVTIKPPGSTSSHRFPDLFTHTTQTQYGRTPSYVS